jgi:hypothetical protein
MPEKRSDQPLLKGIFRKYETFLFLCLFVIISEATYFRANTLEFGRLDDFTGLVNSRTHALSEGMYHGWFQAGRFIPASLGSLFFSYTKSVSDLQYLRLISAGIIGLGGGIIALFVWKLFKRENLASFAAAILVGVISITTTSAPSAATWATLASQMFTIPLALVGGIVCTTNRRYFRLPWWVISTGLLLFSAFCYQQYVPLAALPVCMWAAIQYVSTQQIHWKKIVLILVQIVVALGTNALYVLNFGDGAQDRVLRGAFSDRIYWFVGTYIPRTIDIGLPNSQKSGLISLLILGILLLFPVLVNRRNIVFMFAAIISWATCAIVIFPTELWASYRLIHPAQMALWGGAAFGFVFATRTRNMRFILAAGLLVGVFAIQQADQRAYNFIALPNHFDWETTKCEIERNPGINTFVINESDVSRSRVFSYDEVGTIASNFDWVFELSIKMARSELIENGKLETQATKPTLISTSDSANLPAGTFLVIDQNMCK